MPHLCSDRERLERVLSSAWPGRGTHATDLRSCVDFSHEKLLTRVCMEFVTIGQYLHLSGRGHPTFAWDCPALTRRLRASVQGYRIDRCQLSADAVCKALQPKEAMIKAPNSLRLIRCTRSPLSDLNLSTKCFCDPIICRWRKTSFSFEGLNR